MLGEPGVGTAERGSSRAGGPPAPVQLRSRRWSPALPLWALRLVRLVALVVTKGVIEGDVAVLVFLGGPVFALVAGWSVYVRRASTVTVGPAGVTVRVADPFVRGTGVHTVPLSMVDGCEVRRWYPPSLWLDLFGPRWVRPSICMSLRLVDGGYVRLPMLTRPRWRVLPGPRVLSAGSVSQRLVFVGSRHVALPRWHRWRAVRAPGGGALRWDRGADAELVARLEGLVERAAACDHSSPALLAEEREPAARWLRGALGLVDLQERRWWTPEDGCRGQAVSAPLSAGSGDGGAGEVAPDPFAAVSWRVARRSWPGWWRPLRATYRVSIGRSGVTIREWSLASCVPLDEVARFELRRWPGNSRHRPLPVPVVVALALHDGRFVALPGFVASPADRRRVRVLVRSGVLGRWRRWGEEADRPWGDAAGPAVVEVLNGELERFRRLGLPSVVDGSILRLLFDPALLEQPYREDPESALAHRLDQRGADGRPPRSEPLTTPV